jgi:hypothetical protein
LCALPSIFELTAEGRKGVRFAVADRVMAPSGAGGLESWDLILYGDNFVPLTSDPFSFRGDFSHQGRYVIAVSLLGPAGFESQSRWIANHDRTGFYTIFGDAGPAGATDCSR